MLPSDSVKFIPHGSVGESKNKSDFLFPHTTDLSDSPPVSPYPTKTPPTISADILFDTAYLGPQPSVTSGKDRLGHIRGKKI